jgi:hypothetical protein
MASPGAAKSILMVPYLALAAVAKMPGGKRLNFPMRLCIFAEDLTSAKKAFFCYFFFAKKK